MRLRVASATDKGQVREINEDACALRVEEGLFVVCDGMGGAAAGEVASGMAVRIILEHFNGTPHDPGVASAADADYLPQTTWLATALRRSNRAIYDQSQQDEHQAGMGTTAVAAVITGGIASLAHVGDSRAYLWRNDEFEPLTRDHSLVEEQVRAGILTYEQSLQSEQQNILLRALGGEPDVEVEMAEVPLQPGDYVLLCSDGLTRMLPDAALAAAISDLRDPQQICDHLIVLANRHGGADNITVVVVEVTGSWWRHLWTRWRRPT